ncbi:hypothetical protein SAMN05444156_2327 [Verrucomicrobium sp. GAS474]|nr:hypothetical protein SAMN05444156_2327 [Verrucomicrobium sp. GAS474]
MIVRCWKGGDAARNIAYILGKKGTKCEARGDLKGYGQVTPTPDENVRAFAAFRPDIKGREVRHDGLSLERWDAYSRRLDAWREAEATAVGPDLDLSDLDPFTRSVVERVEGMTTQEEYKALAADILAENDPLLADQLAPNSPWVAGTHLNTEAHHSHHATSNYDPETGKCLDIRPEKLKGLQRMKWAVGVEPGKGDPDRNDLTIGKEKAPKSKGADINDDGATVTQTPMPGPISPNSGTHAEKVAAVRSAALSRHDDALVRLAEKIDAEGIDALKASGRLTIKATTKAGGFRLNPTLTVDGERFRFDRLRASGIPSLSTPEVFMTPTAGKRRSGSGGDGGASELRGGADPLIDDAKPKIHVFGVQGDLPRRHDPEAHRLAEKARKDADALAEKAKAEKAKTDKATSTSKGPMPMPTLPHGEAAAKARARKVAEEDAAARKAKAAFKKAQKLKAKYQLAKMLLDGNSANSAIETVAKTVSKQIAMSAALSIGCRFIPGLGWAKTAFDLASWLKGSDFDAGAATEVGDDGKPKVKKTPKIDLGNKEKDL